VVIAGAILAAGRSSRMGFRKALLPLHPSSETFVTRLVTTLRLGGVADVIVVLRAGDAVTHAAVEAVSPPVRVAFNTDAERGQLSSLVCAIDAAESVHADGLLVIPVDMPLVRPDTIARMMVAFAERQPPIARAAHRARHGHPVVFARRMFAAVRAADPAVGAKSVVRACGASVLDVPVDDEGVLTDVDDPAAYRALFGADPPR
jgi:CTP:molybdopterin cytidylyltransferase MocA